MTDIALSDAERQLIQNAGAGRPTVFDAAAPAQIRAAVLRNLVAGIPFHEGYGLHCVTDDVARVPATIDLANAEIDGVLDLEGVTGTHGETECPGLVLRGCRVSPQSVPALLDGGVPQPDLNLRHARLARLELHGCGFAYVDLSHASISGSFEMQGRRSATAQAGSWLRAVGVRIGGSVVLRDGAFTLPPAQVQAQAGSAVVPEYAVNFREARLEGTLLVDDSTLLGGLRLPRFVTGDVWLRGVRVRGWGKDAIVGQRTQVGGLLCLQPFRRSNDAAGRVLSVVEGAIDLMAARLGLLSLESVSLFGGDDLGVAADERTLLICDMLETNHNVLIDQYDKLDSPLSGRLSFASSRIGGNLAVYLQGNSDRVALDVTAAVVSGSCVVAAPPDWRLDRFSSVRQGDALVTAAVQVEAGLLQVGFGLILEGSFARVNLRGVQVGGDLSMQAASVDRLDAPMCSTKGELTLPASVFDGVSFENSSIGQGVRIEGTRLRPLRTAKDSKPLLNLADTKVSTDLRIRELTLDDPGLLRHAYRPWLIPDRQSQVFVASPECFGGRVDLIEVHDRPSGQDHVFVLSLLVSRESGPFYLLDGRSDPFHLLAAAGQLKLDTPQEAESYIRLFLGYLWQGEASFVIVDDVDQAPWIQLAADADRSQIPPASIELYRDGDDWEAWCTLAYGRALYRSKVRVYTSTGGVEMVEDRALLDLDALLFSNQGDLRAYHPIVLERKGGGPVHAMAAAWRRAEGEEASHICNLTRTGLRMQLLNGLTPHAPGHAGQAWHRRAAAVARDALQAWRADAAGAGRLKRLAGVLRVHLGRGSGPRPVHVDLTDMRCGAIEDNGGLAWREPVRADLEGFQYDGFDEPVVEIRGADAERPEAKEAFASAGRADGQGAAAVPLAVRLRALSARLLRDARDAGVAFWRRQLRREHPSRLAWLNRVSAAEHPLPQPYEHLAALYRKRGEYEPSRRTMVALEWHKPLKGGWLGYPFVAFLRTVYGLGFGFGLDGWRAFWTCLFYVWIGACFTVFMNTGRVQVYPAAWPDLPVLDAPILVTDTLPTSSVAQVDAAGIHAPAVPPAPPGSAADLACGDQIDPLVYALDAMLPVVDLHQEDKCEVSGEAGAVWRIGRALYAVIGALLISAAILTWTGVLRRNIDA